MFSAILEESETQRFGNVVVRNENNFGVPENSQHFLVEFVSHEQFCVLSSV